MRLQGALAALGLAAGLSGPAAAVSSDPITVAVGLIIPLATEDESDPGLVVELVRETQRRAGRPQDRVEVLPWSRALSDFNQGKVQMLAPFSRTPEREPRYVWAIPLMDFVYAFGTLPPMRIDSLEQASRLESVAVWRDSSLAQFLSEQGFGNLNLTDAQAAARMLSVGRVDAWYSSLAEAVYTWRKLFGDRPLIMGAEIKRSPIWLGVTQTLPPEIVAQYRTGFRSAVTEGRYDQIMVKYLGVVAAQSRATAKEAW